MRLRIAVLSLVMLGCAPTSPGPGIDVTRAMNHVEALAATIGPRRGDTTGSRRAAEYIEAQLPGRVERFAVGTVELPAIVVLGTTYRAAHHVTTTDPDLVVRLGPPTLHAGKALLVMAHYDTVAGSPGAVDNAAAVGVLIELARVLANEPPPMPVMLVFTANEELGLVGAEALAADHGDEIDLALALDLVGGSGELSINGASTLIGSAELRWLAGAADRAGVVLRAPPAHRVVSRWWPQAERADHGAFTRRGIRALHLYDRGQDGEWIDRAYHSARDTVARVDRASVDELGRLLRALTASPVPAHAGDGFWIPVVANTVIPRWCLLIMCLGLAGVAIALIFANRSLRGKRDPAVGRRLGLVVGVGCYAIAAAAVIVLERAMSGGHPAPWLHAPLRFAVAEALLLGGVLGLATRALSRLAPWSGERRYLAVATIGPLVIGVALLAVGAAELAWIWLLPAAAAALAPRLGRAGIVAVLTLALPGVLVLAPVQLREAAWNGFLPVGVPLGAWLATLSFPVFAGLAWYLRTSSHSGPLGTFILSMGCLLAILVGLALVLTSSPACTALQFHDFHLGCEQVLGVR